MSVTVRIHTTDNTLKRLLLERDALGKAISALHEARIDLADPLLDEYTRLTGEIREEIANFEDIEIVQ